MKLLAKFGAIFDRLLDVVSILACILLVFIMLSVCAEVVLRYFLGSPLIWVIEISEMNLLYITFLAIAWVLRRPEVTAAIVGARRPSQIEETAGAADWELSSGDLAEIDALLGQREKTLASA